MNRLSQIIFFFAIILLVSCYSKTEQISGKDLVRSKDMVSILTEVHLAGGVLILPEVTRRFAFKDSLSSYSDIIEKYGYTKEQLDNTMKYYFVKKPRQLQEIYDKVLSKLSEMETQIDTTFLNPVQPFKNLWQGKLSYSLPDDGVKERVWFDIPLQDTGTYILSTTVFVYADDESIDPGMNVFFWKDDGTTDGVRDYWKQVTFFKDGETHQYSLSKKLTDTTYTRLRGWLLDNKAQSGIWEKHMNVESITLYKE
jgi:hypothetical protein